MTNNKHLATISILIKDRQSHAEDVNKMLTENGHIILARLGLNVQKACIEHCTGFITIMVEGGLKEIKDLAKKIDGLYGIVAKANIMTD